MVDDDAATAIVVNLPELRAEDHGGSQSSFNMLAHSFCRSYNAIRYYLVTLTIGAVS
jgi:hypothetical protein